MSCAPTRRIGGEHALILALLLLAAPPLTAAPVPMGDTGYTIELPAGMPVVTPGAPLILFQATRPDQNASIQAVSRPNDRDASTLVRGGWFAEIGQVLPGLALQDEHEVRIAGQQTSWALYRVRAQGQAVTVQAIWVPGASPPLVIQALSIPAHEGAMKKALLSVARAGAEAARRGPSAGGGPASGPSGDPATADASREVSIPGTPCRITPPPGWQVGPGQQGAVLAFDAPDSMASIQVNVTPLRPGQDRTVIRDAMATAVEQSVLADPTSGFRRTGEHVSTSQGIETRMRRYRGTAPTLPGDLLFAFSGASQHVISFNIVVASAARSRLDPVAKACVGSLRDPALAPGGAAATAPTTRPPATRPPTTRPPPSTRRPPRSEPLENLLAREEVLMGEGHRRPLDPDLTRRISSLRAEIAVALAARGNVERAVDYLTRSVQFDPGHPDRLERLADLLQITPEPAASALACSYYEDALALAPDRRACRRKAVAACQAAGELEAARHHLEVLVENAGGAPDPEPVGELALAYLALGVPEQGAGFLERMLGRGGGPRFRLNRAILLRAAGRLDEARRQLRELAGDPNDPALARHADELERTYATLEGGDTR